MVTKYVSVVFKFNFMLYFRITKTQFILYQATFLAIKCARKVCKKSMQKNVTMYTLHTHTPMSIYTLTLYMGVCV